MKPRTTRVYAMTDSGMENPVRKCPKCKFVTSRLFCKCGTRTTEVRKP